MKGANKTKTAQGVVQFDFLRLPRDRFFADIFGRCVVRTIALVHTAYQVYHSNARVTYHSYFP